MIIAVGAALSGRVCREIKVTETEKMRKLGMKETAPDIAVYKAVGITTW